LAEQLSVCASRCLALSNSSWNHNCLHLLRACYVTVLSRVDSKQSELLAATDWLSREIIAAVYPQAVFGASLRPQNASLNCCSLRARKYAWRPTPLLSNTSACMHMHLAFVETVAQSAACVAAQHSGMGTHQVKVHSSVASQGAYTCRLPNAMRCCCPPPLSSSASASNLSSTHPASVISLQTRPSKAPAARVTHLPACHYHST
jgi:hypothetical protein